MSEKLCLQWNDFKENITIGFGSLREDGDFADVTLACEDGKQVEAHKVILAASSPFFKDILRRNKHAHPLIYMRGMKSDDLLAIVDFLYCGEANVFQENLDSFLVIAEELQLNGLTGKADHHPEEQKETFKISGQKRPTPARKEEINNPKMISPNDLNYSDKILRSEFKLVGGTVAIRKGFPGDLQELDEQTNLMMEKTSRKIPSGKIMKPLYICKVCGKEGENGQLKTHIEATHLEGVAIPCSICEKTFRCKKSLASHNNRNHKSR